MISLFWPVMARVREVIVSFLSFLYCGNWGSKCVKYSGLVTKYVNKVLLGLPFSRLSELSSLFKLMVIFVPLTLPDLRGGRADPQRFFLDNF